MYVLLVHKIYIIMDCVCIFCVLCQVLVLNYPGDQGRDCGKTCWKWLVCVSTLSWRLPFFFFLQAVKTNQEKWRTAGAVQMWNSGVEAQTAETTVSCGTLLRSKWEVKRMKSFQPISCRIKFENQLYQLMEQHKILNSMFVRYCNN